MPERSVLAHAVLKTDASQRSGLGHLRRCLPLAHALRTAGVRMSIWIEGVDALTLVRAEGFAVAVVEPAALPEAGEADLMIFDGYHYDAQLVAEACARATVVVALEDLPEQCLPAHLVLNPGIETPLARERCHPDTEFLVGPSYALVPAEFLNPFERTYAETITRVVLTVGGADSLEIMPWLMECARRALPGVALDVIVGPFFTNRAEIERVAQRLGNSSVWSTLSLAQLRELMLRADLAISAGGQTLYQLAACGTPTITLALFDNQLNQTKLLAQRGVIEWACDWQEPYMERRLAAAIAKLSGASARRALGETAQRLIDGRGPTRAAAAIIKRLEQTSKRRVQVIADQS